MNKGLNILILLALIGGAGYHFRSILFPPVPCAEPIEYALGNFAPEFKISEKYFLSALADAEVIWEKPSGKDLFVYAPTEDSDDVLKVNLIYDYRQQATSKLDSLDIVVDNNRASYETLKAKLNTLKADYESDKKSFNAKVESFNTRQDSYGREVDSWNDKGGAPKAEYERLERERLAFQAESVQLKILQNHLNAQVDEINALVVALNRLIASLNLSVEKYNSVNEARGESFEEGVYHTDGVDAEIDIYEFSSREKLVRVLAHELGHALGLAHVEDSKAIMYKLNEGNTQALTAADIAALDAQCPVIK